MFVERLIYDLKSGNYSLGLSPSSKPVYFDGSYNT